MAAPIFDGPDGKTAATLFEILRAVRTWSLQLRTATNDDERRIILDKIDELIGE